MNIHSRGSALLTGDHLDRTQLVQYSATVPDGTGLTVVVTYTVGVNISAKIETTLLHVGVTAAINTAIMDVSARGWYLDIASSLIANVNVRSFAPHLLLTAGQTAQLRVFNASGGGVVMIGTINIREIDL